LFCLGPGWMVRRDMSLHFISSHLSPSCHCQQQQTFTHSHCSFSTNPPCPYHPGVPCQPRPRPALHPPCPPHPNRRSRRDQSLARPRLLTIHTWRRSMADLRTHRLGVNPRHCLTDRRAQDMPHRSRSSNPWSTRKPPRWKIRPRSSTNRPDCHSSRPLWHDRGQDTHSKRANRL
jgi:hypothetical protein